MEDSLVIPPSVKVFVRLGKHKGSRAGELVSMLRDYKDDYTSLELQEEAMKWRTGKI